MYAPSKEIIFLPLIVAFDSQELRSICEYNDIAIEKLGEHVADLLHHRLSDIFAAETVADLLVGNPQKIGEHPYLNYVVTISNSIKMEFCSNVTKKSYLENGELDWSKVTRIKLLKIGYSNE